MSIIYAVIVRQDTNGNQVTLCNYDAARGNYPSITENILKKIKIVDKISYKYNEEYVYHISKDRNLLFVCLADSSVKVKTAFIFLEDINKKFREKYSEQEIENSITFSMNSSFTQIFKQQFTFFNSNKDPDQKETLTKELERLQQTMNQNIEKVLQREEKVEMTVKKAVKFQSISQQMASKSKRMNQEAFWAKHKCKLLLISLLVLAGGAFFFII